MTVFQYHPDIIDRFPLLTGGAVLATGLTNGPTPDGLRAAYEAEQAAVRQRIGDTPLSELPSLAGWRSAFRAFGVDPTQYRSAAEALLRRLTKKGDIPSINTLVDLGNLVSIRYGLPVAVVDRRGFEGTLTVRFASGDERFTDLNSDTVVHPEPGEVIFSDTTGQITARRWCWRQSDQSASRPDTTGVLITVEAQHAGGRADVVAALDDLQALLAAHTSGMIVDAAVLDGQRPGL
jgi:DNA/RNA-binding domain of Phe-tRNA-synthetase-like protein